MRAPLPTVSIVINNYNYARFLTEAIESALAQTVPAEVVVVDDGSTDGSRGIIQRYAGRVVTVLKENGGQASAFNAGFAACTGDWIIFLDADDRLAPTVAERVAAAARPGLAKIQYRLQLIDARGEPMPTLVPPAPHRMPQGDVRGEILARGCYNCPPTTGNAFHRQALARMFPMPEAAWRLAADSYTFLLAPFFGDVLSLDEPLGDYRHHGSNNWLNTRFDLAVIARQVDYDLKKEALIREAASAHGLSAAPSLALRNQVHVTLRLALRLHRPEGSADEDVWRLCRHGLRASWRDPYKRLHGRLLLVAWWLTMPWLPPAAGRAMVRWKIDPASRPGFLRRARFGTTARATVAQG